MLVTVYVPAVLAARFIIPFKELIESPADALYTPFAAPRPNTGVGFAAFIQYGEFTKLKVAIGNCEMVTGLVAITEGHPLEAAIVLVIVKLPALLAVKFISPEALFMFSPAVEENVPATELTASVGSGLDAF